MSTVLSGGGPNKEDRENTEMAEEAVEEKATCPWCMEDIHIEKEPHYFLVCCQHCGESAYHER